MEMALPRVQPGADVAVAGRHFRQADEGIHPGHRRRQFRHRRSGLGNLAADPAVDGTLHLLDALPGREDQGFILLEFRDDVPFRVGQSLAADVVPGNLGLAGVADLDVIAEHLVVAHLQAPDAGALPFLPFQPGDKAAGFLGLFLELVQLGGKAGANDVAIPGLARRLRGDGRLYQRFQVGHGGKPSPQPAHARRLPAFIPGGFGVGFSIGVLRQRIRQAGDSLQARFQGQQFPGMDDAGRGAAQDAFQIGNPGEQGRGGAAPEAVPDEMLHRVQPPLQGRQFHQGLAQPAAQQAPAHGRPGRVQAGQQGKFPALGPARLEKLQVAPGRSVQGHVRRRGIQVQPVQPRPTALPGAAQVIDNGPSRPDGQGFLPSADAKGFQGQDAVMFQQGLLRQVVVEGSRVDPRYETGSVLAPFRRLPPCRGLVPQGRDDFRGADSLQFQRRFLHAHLGGGEFPGGNIDVSQARRIPLFHHGGQEIVALLVQQRRFHRRAGSNHAHHVPFHQPLAGRRVGKLLADGDLVPLLHQPGQVTVQGMGGNAGHRHLQALAHAAGRKDNFQRLGSGLGVVVESLVEVAQAEKHDGVGVGMFDFQILPANRRQRSHHHPGVLP